jgi:predicted ATPase
LYHDKQPVFLSEKGRALLFDDTHHETAGFPPDIFRSGLAAITPPDAGFERFAWFKRWLGSVQCVRIDPFRMDGRADKEAIFAEADFGNFASWYRHLVLEQSAAVGDLRDTLRETIDGFDSLDLKEAGRGVRLLTVILRSSDHDVPVQSKGRFDLGFEELSDGQRALIGLYTVLHCFAQRGALLCIDEPDNFISLAEIQPWLQRLEDRADDEEAQLLLISHHPELLNQLAADHGIVFSRPGGRHVTVTPYKGAPGSELPPAEQIARGWADG